MQMNSTVARKSIRENKRTRREKNHKTSHKAHRMDIINGSYEKER